MKISVYGSASGEIDSGAEEKARILGKEIAKQGHVLITGGCTGIPYEAVKGANEEKGKCIAFCPAINLEEHKKTGYPFEGFSEFVFVPESYEFKDVMACKLYRNISSVMACDIAIIIAGRMGTLNEFLNAYNFGKVIGVLEETGGVTKRAIKVLLEDVEKETGAKVIFDSDPTILLKKVVEAVNAV